MRAITGSLLALWFGASPWISIATAQEYDFRGGYPTPEPIQKAYDDADLSRATEAYKFFYPTVSFEATWRGNLKEGAVANAVFALLEGTPFQIVFTPNSDTPYSGLPLDLGDGPMVIELPPGPLMGAADDLNQRWVMDLGLPGPDAGKGGKHLILPPGYKGESPRVLVLLRAIPPGGDNEKANALMKTVKVYPLNRPVNWKEPSWVKLTKGDFTPIPWETNLQFWQVLKEVIDTEPAYEAYRSFYGDWRASALSKVSLSRRMSG